MYAKRLILFLVLMFETRDSILFASSAHSVTVDDTQLVIDEREGAGSGTYCGVYSVCGALAALGKSCEISELVQPKFISEAAGSTMADLSSAAISRGAHVLPLTNLSVDDLCQLSSPVILNTTGRSWEHRYNHWALFLGCDGGKLRLLDAPRSVALISRADLLAQWGGTGLVVSDQPIALPFANMSHLWIVTLIFCAVCGRIITVQRNTVTERHTFSENAAKITAIIAIATTLGLAWHSFSEIGFMRNNDALTFVWRRHHKQQFPEVTVERLADFVKSGVGVVVDARVSADYKRGHVPGAISIPIDATPADAADALRTIAKDTPIIIYCQSSGCHYGELVAGEISLNKFTDVSLFTGGWNEWTSANFASPGLSAP